MVNRTFLLLFYLVFSLFVQSAFTARFDESMNELKQSMYNGAQTVKDSATSAGAYVKDKANHFMYAPGNAPAHAPLKAKNHHAHAPDVSSHDDKHNIVLHASKIPTYKDVTGDPKSAFKNWAYAPNPAAAPMTNKASQMYHSAAVVKDPRKKIYNTIHAAMSDVMHKSSKHHFSDVTGADAKKTYTNWAHAPTPAVAPSVNAVSGAAKKKIHNTIHTAMKGVNGFLPNTANTRFSDVTGHWAHAPSYAPRPSATNAASKRIQKTIRTAMNDNSHMAKKPTTFSDATGKTAASFHDWANSPSPLSAHAPRNSMSNVAGAVQKGAKKLHNTIHTAMNDNSHMAKKPTIFSDATGKTSASFHDWANSPSPLSAHAPGNSVRNVAGAVQKGAKKLHNTIHTSVKDKVKHHFNDITGRDPFVINDFAHAPAPSSYAAAPTKQAGKKIHYKIHAAMNEKARQILPNKGKHQYSDRTGVDQVGTFDFTHAPAPAPTRKAVGSAKTFGKRIQNTIHVALKDKASKAAKHQYNDKTGPGSVAAGTFAHAPTPAPLAAAGAVKDAGKKLHKTVHAYMYNNNPEANSYNPYYNNLGKRNWNNGADDVQGHQEHSMPQAVGMHNGEVVVDAFAENP